MARADSEDSFDYERDDDYYDSDVSLPDVDQATRADRPKRDLKGKGKARDQDAGGDGAVEGARSKRRGTKRSTAAYAGKDGQGYAWEEVGACSHREHASERVLTRTMCFHRSTSGAGTSYVRTSRAALKARCTNFSPTRSGGGPSAPATIALDVQS